MEQMVLMEQQVHKVLLERMVLMEQMVQMEQQAHKVLPEQMVLMV